MPLITITCTDRYFPPERTNPGYEMQEKVYQYGVLLARNLFSLMRSDGEVLGLNPHTSQAAIQVDFQKFHRRAINPVDIWTKVKFTEPDPGDEKRIIVRDKLIAMLDDIMVHQRIFHNNTFLWALDGFFDGPGFGCIANQAGEIIEKW